jgi:hypothetical protein
MPAITKMPAVARCLGQSAKLWRRTDQIAQASRGEFLRIGLAALPLDARR